MQLKKTYPYILISMIALVIMIPQIHAHAFIYGVDSAFHMNRFYDTAMQIKTQQYSYFQSFFGFQQSGRVINALYGPLFAYINGALLLIAKTWYHYQIISSFLALFTSGSLMYYLSIKNQVRTGISILMATLYMMSDPVMAWLVGQQFTGWGAAFLPLVILMGTEMMRKRQISVIKLALAMTILLQVHMMTSLMATMALIPFFIVGWWLSPQRLQMMLNLVKAIGLTLLLTANVWGGMLELSLTNHLLPVAPGINVSVTAPRVAGQSQAIAASAASVGTGSGLNTLGITPVYLWILLIVGLYLLINIKQVAIASWIIALNGAMFLWLSSDYFPWHQVANGLPAVDYIQFPSRFLVVAIILLLLSLGMCLSHQNHSPIIILFKICFAIYILVVFNTNSYQAIHNGVTAFKSPQVVLPDRNLTVAPLKPNQLRKVFNDQDLSRAINVFNKPTPDYLPFFVKIRPDQYWIYHPYHLYKSQILTNLPTNQKTSRSTAPIKKTVSKTGLNVTWTNPLKHKWWIAIPVINYAHTVVVMNGKQVKVDTSTIGKLFIDSKPGVNHAQISYHPSRWFKYLVLITLVSWLGILCYAFSKLWFKMLHNITKKDKNV